MKDRLLNLGVLAAISIATIALFTKADAPRSYTPAMAYNIMTRTLGTAFMVSDQRQSIVTYNILITNTATLVAGNSGQALLQTKTGAGAWTTISTGQNTVGSGLVYSGSNTQSVFGVVQRGDSVRIIQNNLVGTPTYGQPVGVEIQLN